MICLKEGNKKLLDNTDNVRINLADLSYNNYFLDVQHQKHDTWKKINE